MGTSSSQGAVEGAPWGLGAEPGPAALLACCAVPGASRGHVLPGQNAAPAPGPGERTASPRM